MSAKSWISRNRIPLLQILCGFLAAVFCATLSLDRSPLLERAGNLFYDEFMRLLPEETESSGVVVKIDDESLAKIGRWPWPRRKIAELAQACLDRGALFVGLDMLLSEPDSHDPEGDRILGDLIKKRPVASGIFIDYAGLSGKAAPGSLPKGLNPIWRQKGDAAPHFMSIVPEGKGAIVPIPELAGKTGIINAPVESDGLIRGSHLLSRIGGRIYPSLSLRALLEMRGRKSVVIENRSEEVALMQAAGSIFPIRASSRYNFRVKRESEIPSVSAADILAGKRPDLAGKAVFIGATAPGLYDRHTTNLQRVMPGVYTHVSALDAMLGGKAMEFPHLTGEIQVIIIISCAAIAVAFALLPNTLIASVLSILFLICLPWLSFLLFRERSFISPAPGLLSAFLSGGSAMTIKFIHEYGIRRRFSRYVSPEIAKRLARRPPPDGGELKEISVLFSDIRGFTTISQYLRRAESIFGMLDMYLGEMVPCALRRKGTLDKFVGDAVMAYWNAPLDVHWHQIHALAAALDMQEKLNMELRGRIADKYPYPVKPEEPGEPDRAVINIGIGLHSDKAQIGNLGADSFANFTCIGNGVNLASRLEGLTKKYGVNIIASGAIRDAFLRFIRSGSGKGESGLRELRERLGRIRFFYLGKVRVKGNSDALRIYAPMPYEREDGFSLEWAKAMACYLKGYFDIAECCFVKLSEKRKDPFEKGMCRTFAERCEELLEKPPEDWTGVYTHKDK